jgi:glycosyltransferase involved in cell wall biosynthesis
VSEAGSLTVAVDTTFADRNRGGSGVYTRSLLAALRARGDTEVRQIAAAPGASFIGTLRWLAAGARRELRRHPPDVLHCPAFVCPWGVPFPYVVTIPDALARRFPGDHPLEWRVYERRLLPGLARRAAFVCTGTEFSRRQLVDEYGLSPDRVVVTPLGVDARFADLGARRRPGPGALGEPPRLLFPGAPLGRKNLPLVLRCLAEAREGALARARLEISGALPDAFPEHRRLISSLGLEGRVRWLGQVEDADMPSLVAGADVLVYPSLGEGFGLPPLEAMAAGTPVVAANASCLPEVCGEGALLADPTDVHAFSEALEAVLTRPDLREHLRETGRRVAAAYTWERCAERTRQVYAWAARRPAAAISPY